jgi:hypothetical protein
MNLIENYEKACKDIAEHVGCKGCISDYPIYIEDINCFFTFSAENRELNWSDDKGEVEVLYGDDLYNSDCGDIYRGEEFTLALVNPDYGEEDYWIVFKTKNEIK